MKEGDCLAVSLALTENKAPQQRDVAEYTAELPTQIMKEWSNCIIAKLSLPSSDMVLT